MFQSYLGFTPSIRPIRRTLSREVEVASSHDTSQNVIEGVEEGTDNEIEEENIKDNNVTEGGGEVALSFLEENPEGKDKVSVSA